MYGANVYVCVRACMSAHARGCMCVCVCVCIHTIAHRVCVCNLVWHSDNISHTHAPLCTQLRLYNKMTMEVILSTAFGRALDVQGGKGGKLFESAVAVFNALGNPKENERKYIFQTLQFLLCKFTQPFCSCMHSIWHKLNI